MSTIQHQDTRKATQPNLIAKCFIVKFLLSIFALPGWHPKRPAAALSSSVDFYFCNVWFSVALNLRFITHERDVREEQHPYVCGANKQ